MKKTLLTLAAAAATFVSAASAVTITQWNFNTTDAASFNWNSPAPSTGFGTASLFGGATGTSGSGISNGGSSDTTAGSPPNYGWQTLTYGSGTNAGAAGVQFAISTVGFTSAAYESFTFSFDLRHSNTSSRYEQVQYTVDGTNWLNAGSYFDGNAGDTWFKGRTVIITDPAIFDNELVAFRVTTSNGPGTSLVASNTSSTYASSGTWRFDMVTLSATPIPEPSAFAALAGLGALGFAASRRRRHA